MAIIVFLFLFSIKKKLYVYCFRCSRVGHGKAHYNFVSCQQHRPVQPIPPVLSVQEMEQIKQTMQLDEDHKPWDGATIDLEICSQAHIGEDDDSKEFGPWLKP